jgi:phosphoglycerate dehydrogenase-like enzyme
MAGSVVHVYHAHAASIAAALRPLVPTRTVVELTTADALHAALGELEVLVAPSPPRAGWASASRLRLIQLLGVGAEGLLPSPDLPAAVEIVGVRGEFADLVVEHVVAVMLALVKQLPALLEAQARREFRSRPMASVAGRVMTIVGLGEVGGRLAAVAQALGMTVRGVCARPDARPRPAGVAVFAAGEVATAIAGADVVVLAAPHTPVTARLIDAAMLARMGAQALLINVARGGLVDEAALAEALAGGRLGGAALDVFDEEPLPPDHALWAAPNVMITPHVAGLGVDYVARCLRRLVANLGRLDAGAPREGVIDRLAYY